MLSLSKNLLDIELNPDTSSQFHYVWLRDNCGCEQCFHPDTNERLLVTHCIAEDIAPQSASIEDEHLVICWNDEQHQSRYPLEWLKTHDYSKSSFDHDPACGQIKLWDKSFQNDIPSFQYNTLYDSDQSQFLEFCESLRDYG